MVASILPQVWVFCNAPERPPTKGLRAYVGASVNPFHGGRVRLGRSKTSRMSLARAFGSCIVQYSPSGSESNYNLKCKWVNFFLATPRACGWVCLVWRGQTSVCRDHGGYQQGNLRMPAFYGGPKTHPQRKGSSGA